MELPQHRLERNIGRYLAFVALSMTFFALPVIVLFWQENGLDLFQVFVLQAIYAVAVVLLEVPTGMVADRMGKRTSLLLGAGITSVGLVAYALGHGFAAFLGAELLLALGMALNSGAGSALLYDTLRALGREVEFERLEGRARAIQEIVFGSCNLIGGLVGSVSYRATLWLSALGPPTSLVIGLGLTEVQRPVAATGWRAGLRAYLELIGSSLRFVGKHRLVRWQITFLAVLMGSATWLLWLYQPYMRASGLPVWAFGAAFTLFNLGAALASQLAHRVDRRCGRRGTILLLVVLQLLPLLLLALLVGPASFLFILGHQAVRGLAPPIVHARILRYTFADKRATVLSLSSMASRLFFAATAPLVGWLTRRTSLRGSLLGQAAVLGLFLGALLLRYLAIPAKYLRVKEEVEARQ